MGIDWVESFERATGARLDARTCAFLAEVAKHAPGCGSIWGDRDDGRGAAFDRLAIEGTADNPTLVCYFRYERKRPGLLLAFEWPLAEIEMTDRGGFAWSVWMANFMEFVDEAGGTLPTVAGVDGIARALPYALQGAPLDPPT